MKILSVATMETFTVPGQQLDSPPQDAIAGGKENDRAVDDTTGGSGTTYVIKINRPPYQNKISDKKQMKKY